MCAVGGHPVHGPLLAASLALTSVHHMPVAHPRPLVLTTRHVGLRTLPKVPWRTDNTALVKDHSDKVYAGIL